MKIEDARVSLALHPAGDGEVDISAVERAFGESTGEVFQIAERGEGIEFINFQARLSVNLQPDQIVVTDYSGLEEVREELIHSVSEIRELLRSTDLQPQHYEWKVEGVITDIDQLAPMAKLFDVSRVDEVIGGDIDPTWMVEELKLTSSSTFADWLDVELTWAPRRLWGMSLKVVVTGLFVGAGSWKSGDLEGEGRAVQSAALGIIQRLVSENPPT